MSRRSKAVRTFRPRVTSAITAATLIALGCVRAQGFLFAKPCLTQEFESMLEMKGETKRLAP